LNDFNDDEEQQEFQDIPENLDEFYDVFKEEESNSDSLTDSSELAIHVSRCICQTKFVVDQHQKAISESKSPIWQCEPFPKMLTI
jgi:hypothetical protein